MIVTVSFLRSPPCEEREECIAISSFSSDCEFLISLAVEKRERVERGRTSSSVYNPVMRT
jgi:hypothetical protein